MRLARRDVDWWTRVDWRWLSLTDRYITVLAACGHVRLLQIWLNASDTASMRHCRPVTLPCVVFGLFTYLFMGSSQSVIHHVAFLVYEKKWSICHERRRHYSTRPPSFVILRLMIKLSCMVILTETLQVGWRAGFTSRDTCMALIGVCLSVCRAVHVGCMFHVVRRLASSSLYSL